MRRFSLLAFSAALATQAHGLIDINTNGLSDLWEKSFHSGQLFSAANPVHTPTADPDGDGWTNLQEAAAGTNPFDSKTPAGFVRPEISHTPGTYEQRDTSSAPITPPPDPMAAAPFLLDPPPTLIDPPIFTLTWPSIAGKTYEVFASENLVDWAPASGAFMGAGVPLSFESENVHSDGTIPEKLF